MIEIMSEEKKGRSIRLINPQNLKIDSDECWASVSWGSGDNQQTMDGADHCREFTTLPAIGDQRIFQVINLGKDGAIDLHIHQHRVIGFSYVRDLLLDFTHITPVSLGLQSLGVDEGAALFLVDVDMRQIYPIKRKEYAIWINEEDVGTDILYAISQGLGLKELKESDLPIELLAILNDSQINQQSKVSNLK